MKIISKLQTFNLATKMFSNPLIYAKDALRLNNKNEISHLRGREGYFISFRNQSMDRHIISEIILHDCYNLRSGKNDKLITILDIGAQAGFFSIYAAALFPESNIYSFEPEKNNFGLLIKNINDNSYQIHPNNFGLGKEETKQKLYLSKFNQGGHSIYPLENNQGVQQILVRSLNNVWEDLNLKSCDLLKMDCEGAEYDILFTLDQRILSKISRIIGEIHDFDEEKNVHIIKKFLIKNNFRVEFKTYEEMGNTVHLLSAINLLNN